MYTSYDKCSTRPGFEPGTSRLQAPVDMNEPSGPAMSQLEAMLYVGTDCLENKRLLAFGFAQYRWR